MVTFVLVADIITGNGFTVMVYVTVVPGHDPSFGVTVMVAVIAVPPVLVGVKLGTSPLPLDPSPMAVLLFDHVNVTPDGVPDKLVTGTVTPAQIIMFAGAVAVGVGFTVTVPVAGLLAQPFNVYVTV